jgi:hypothetical protein
MNALNRRRGAASVELAVSVIFLVPLIMYMIFLQDMLIMKLNGQEAAVQASWDFTVLDYGSQISPHGVGAFTRLTYCDHSAAYDSYSQPWDCDEKGSRHHKAMTAHECWIGTDPKGYGGQVRCTVKEQLQPSGAGTKAVAAFGQGGVVNCRGRLGIMNYYLPNKFLTTFRKGKGFGVNGDGAQGGTDDLGQSSTRKTKMASRWAVGSGQAKSQDDAHGDRGGAKEHGDSSAGSNYWRLAWTDHSMLVDPWALGLAKGEDPIGGIDPDMPSGPNLTNPLYARISAAYATASGATNKAEKWNQDIVSAGMIKGNSRQDVVGDNLTTAAAAFKPNDAQQDFGSHWAAQWGDSRIQQTAGSRQNGYFGLAQ